MKIEALVYSGLVHVTPQPFRQSAGVKLVERQDIAKWFPKKGEAGAAGAEALPPSTH